MLRCCCFLLPAFLWAQAGGPVGDPAFAPLDQAYQALRQKEYGEAIALFRKAIELAPGRPALRKDLGYTLLRVGQAGAARDQFAEAMRLDPKDLHVALEYAYLCHETGERLTAWRVFDRVRKTGAGELKARAEEAFQNIDRPLAGGIARWQEVLRSDPGNFAAHHELAILAEQRDEPGLAAEHFRAAWRILPERRYLLIDLGRMLEQAGRLDEACAAWLAASRGAEPRAAQAAKARLPAHYPYANEFRRAIELDPANLDLRRELAYLFLAMGRQTDAEREFRSLLAIAVDDPLSNAQLGLLLLARGEKAKARPLLDRAMSGKDPAIGNKVRSILGKAVASQVQVEYLMDLKTMAARSLESGYLADAVRYLRAANDRDAEDPWVQLKLGWAYNVLHDDREAVRWFALARRSGDPGIAREAREAWRNLRPAAARVRTTLWAFPFYSSRWRDVFSYAQVKTEFRVPRLPFSVYASTRLLGDMRRRTTERELPLDLSENSIVVAGGIATHPWKGLMAWWETGSAVSYLSKPWPSRTRLDHRGGLMFGRGFGPGAGSGPEAAGVFYESNADGVFVSRFGNDFLTYFQNRVGYTAPRLEALGGLETRWFWAANVTFDTLRQGWANFGEAGPGVKVRWPFFPKNLALTVNYLRGSYLIGELSVRRSNFSDLRAGFGYAFTY